MTAYEEMLIRMLLKELPKMREALENINSNLEKINETLEVYNEQASDDVL